MPSIFSLRSGLALAAAATAACSMSGAEDPSGDGVGFGGAQDIGQFRDILRQGGIPGVDTLDATGFFAEHQVDLPPASCQQTLCLTPMLARGTNWLTRKPQTTLQLTVTTPTDPATLPRRPLDLVVVIDRSGSMSEDGRLQKVQRGLRLLVQQLRAEDRLALVAFDDRVEVRAPWGSSVATLTQAIDNLTPGGSTNLHGGLQAGLLLAASAANPERESRVLFLSDGLATAGITSRSAIIELAERHVAEGIGVSTIGVGRQFDAVLMRSLAERGAGNFYFLEDAQAVDEVFTEELKVSMTPLALDLRLRVTFGPGYNLMSVAGRQGWSGGASGGTLAIPAAFATSRQDAPPTMGRRGGGGALFFELSELPALEGGVVASIELSYRTPGSTVRQVHTATVQPIEPAAADAPQPAVSHPAMQKLAAMYNLYRGLREATVGASQYARCTIGTLRRTADGAARWNLTTADSDVTADLVLIELFIANLRRAGFAEATEAEWNDSYEQCRATPTPSPEEYEDTQHQHMGCSSARSAGGLLPLWLALWALGRRRAGRARRTGRDAKSSKTAAPSPR